MQEKKRNGSVKIITGIALIILIGTMACIGSISDAIGLPAAKALDVIRENGADHASEPVLVETEYAPLVPGDSGEAVLKIKLRLYELGYFETNAFTEIYDKETTEQIALFQEVNELKKTGIADAETLALLFSDQAKELERPEQKDQIYILNTNTKKLHEPDCASVRQMKDKNKKEFTGTRDQAIGAGYEPCKNCNP